MREFSYNVSSSNVNCWIPLGSGSAVHDVALAPLTALNELCGIFVWEVKFTSSCVLRSARVAVKQSERECFCRT